MQINLRYLCRARPQDACHIDRTRSTRCAHSSGCWVHPHHSSYQTATPEHGWALWGFRWWLLWHIKCGLILKQKTWWNKKAFRQDAYRSLANRTCLVASTRCQYWWRGRYLDGAAGVGYLPPPILTPLGYLLLDNYPLGYLHPWIPNPPGYLHPRYLPYG